MMFGLATVRRAINFLKVKFAGIENHPSETNSRVLIFTGAGISAESGIQTFRGEKGLWNGRNVAEVCSSYGFLKDPDPVFDYHFKEVYHMPATEAIRILENRIVEFLGGICFLNENDHEVFMRILTNPPKATRELKKLMATESLDVR